MSTQANDDLIINVKITNGELCPRDTDGGFGIVLYWLGADGSKGVCNFSCLKDESVGGIIAGIVEVVGCSSWEQLRGKFARLKMVPERNDGVSRQCRGALALGHIIENRWVSTGHYYCADLYERN